MNDVLDININRMKQELLLLEEKYLLAKKNSIKAQKTFNKNKSNDNLKLLESAKEDFDKLRVDLDARKKSFIVIVKQELVNIQGDYDLAKKTLKEVVKECKLDKSEENLKKLSIASDHYYGIKQEVDVLKERISLTRKIEEACSRKNLTKQLFENRKLYVLLFPYFFLFMIFTIIPVFMSLGISFTSYDILQPPKFVGWLNYKTLFLDDNVFIIAIKNTIILALVTGPISYLAAFLFAWLINELKPRLRAIMTLVFYAPSISGNVYIIWKLIFSSDTYGYANGFLMKLGITNEAILWLQNPKYIIWIIMLVQLWLSLGVSFLAFIAGLQSTDKTLYEAGAIDGIRNRWQELWYITLPQMKPQLMFGAVMQITTSLAIAEVATQIAGFPSIQYAGHTIITHLMDYGTLRYELGYASAIATVLFLIMILANIVVRKIIRRVGS